MPERSCVNSKRLSQSSGKPSMALCLATCNVLELGLLPVRVEGRLNRLEERLRRHQADELGAL
jgi:hypothetical protein